MNQNILLDVFQVWSPESYDSGSESPPTPPPLRLELPVGLVLPHPKKLNTPMRKVSIKKFRKSTAQSSDIPVKKPVVMKKRLPEKIHYEYLKLNDIISLYPLSEKMYVSIYGIIMSYDKHKETMVILDETFDNFSWFPNIRSSSLTFKTGDIIRVHRLLLEVNKTRHSINERNIVIFESFGDDIFKPQSLAARPTFEDYDNCRVEELTKLNTKYLIEEPIVKKINDFWTIQSAFLVLGVHDDETLSRTIICCWSPHDLFADFPCKPLKTSLEHLSKNVQSSSSDLPLSEAIIRKFYAKQRLIFIKVYGPHRSQANSLKPFDIAVVFNLLREKDRLWEGRYSYKLSDQEKHGQCIRQASNKSHLAERFRKQIMGYLGDEEKLKQLDSAPDYLDETLEKTSNSWKENTESILARVPIFKDVHDFCFSDDSDIDEIKEMDPVQDSSSIIMTSSDDECDQSHNPILLTVDPVGFNDLSYDELDCIEKHFPHFKNDHNPPYEDVLPRYQSIDDVKHLPVETIFVLEAAMFTFYGRTANNETIFDDIRILRPLAMILECTRSECGHKMAFETEQTEIRRGFIKCPKCSHWTCDVFLDLNLILQDQHNNTLDVRWTGHAANHFFKCNIKDLADSQCSEEFALKLKAIIKFLLKCPRFGIDVHWKIQVKDDDQQQPEFRIVYAKPTVNLNPSQDHTF